MRLKQAIAAMVFGGISTVGAAEVYIDESNPYLELCKEFKAYLERHADKQLYCELVPDPEFKEFKLPKLEPAPKGLGERIFIQSIAVQPKSARLSDPHDIDDYQKAVDELKFRHEYGYEYQIGKMDVNHDGNQESVIFSTAINYCKTEKLNSSFIMPYGENHNIDSAWIGADGYAGNSGIPFFYKGRIYLVRGDRVNVSVYEPKKVRRRPFYSGRGICRYRSLIK